MIAFLAIATALAMPCILDDPGKSELGALFAAIDSLQKPVEDFRCEVEGTSHFRGKLASINRVDADGLFEKWSGIYLWKRGGFVRSESLSGLPSYGMYSRHSVSARIPEKIAEYEIRPDDDPRTVISAGIKKLKDVHIWDEGLGHLFLIDKMKWQAANDGFELSVADGALEGHPLKIVNVRLKGLKDMLVGRYFVDLRRSGQVVRVQHYISNSLSGWLDITLAPFKVGDAEVWMPIYGLSVGLMALENGGPILLKETQSIRQTRVVAGSIKFNERLGLDVFTNRYKPSPPQSELYRTLQAAYSAQSVAGPRETGVENAPGRLPDPAPLNAAKEPNAGRSTSGNPRAWMVVGCGTAVLLIALAAILARMRSR
jgi:hypothetical protein